MKKTRIRLSLFSLVLALVLFGLTIRLTGRDPLVVYWSILTGSFGSTKSFLNVLAYMLPLIMTGLGAAVAFQSGVFNIGGEGQVLVGGLASVIVGLTVPLPAPWGWLLALLAGFAAGALWALLPTLFAGRNLTSLSVATIMMNSIAALLTEYIVKSYFQRPGASNTETVVVNEGSILPRIFPSTQFNYGILVALFCVVVVTWMLYKTPFGFSLRAMGSNPRAMQQAGLPIYGRTIAAMCISGGLFALGGSIQCLAVYKRFVMGFSPGYGWDGITVATLAMNSPVGVLLSAFLFGPFYGAVAGGIGSMLADILSGYAFYAPATLVIKGLIAVIAALLWKAMRKRGGDKVWKKILASLVAEIWMAAGYWTFETLFLGEAKAALASVPNNIAQGLVGVVLGMVLYYALSKLPMWKKVQLYA